MKKLIAVLLALLMLVALCACTSTAATDSTPTTAGDILEGDEQPSLVLQPEGDEQLSLGDPPDGDEKSSIDDEKPADSIVEYYGWANPEWIQYVDENVEYLDIWELDFKQVWNVYFEDIQERLNAAEYWDGHELEEAFLDQMGYTTYSDFKDIPGYIEDDIQTAGYPIVYKSKDHGVSVVYITESGSMYYKNGLGFRSWYEDIHTQGNCNFMGEGMSDEEVAVADMMIGRRHNFTAVYRKTTQTFELWQFGELVRSHELPLDSIFVGVSDTEGYLFRAGTDLYAVRDFTDDYYSSPDERCMELIASGVQAVLDDNYFWDLTGFGDNDIDYSSQPFLQMTNGELKVYVPDPDVPANDPSNLKDWRGDAIH